MVKLWLFFLGALLFFTTNLPAQSRSEKEKQKLTECRVQKTTVPLTLRQNVGLITVYVNQHAKTFLVDPAGRTIINSARLKLPQVKQVRSGVIGVAGVVPLDWDIVSIDQFSLGPMKFRHMQVLSRELEPLEQQVGQPLDGILGMDVLKMWSSVSMDFEQNIFVLEDRTSCKGKKFGEIHSANGNENSSPWTYDALRSREGNMPHR